MLKHAIDVYNFLLDILDFIKKPSLTAKSFLFAASATVAVAISLVSVQAISGSNADEQPRQGSSAQALPLSEQPSTTQKPADKTTDVNSTTKTQAKTSPEPAKTGNAGAVSPEPAAARSFSLTVTKNGQYEPGTLIAYDAIKDDKTYYAGDLDFSAGSITVSRSQAATSSSALRVSSPDAANMSVPAEPTNDISPRFTISLDASQVNESSSAYNMIVELKDSVELGTYQLHVAASRNGQTDGAWWYHGFLTVHVVD
jgi:hypothetical protein